LNIKASIYCPKSLASAKRKGIETLGGIIVDHFEGCLDAEINARKDSIKENIPYISPVTNFSI
jgi:threonine dehydratase